jgi:uncharacterized coiled-coil DUF342 family protein
MEFHGERRQEYPKLIERLARLEEKLMAAEKALDVANKSMNERLAGMNEFREQLKDQAGRFMTRIEHIPIEDKFAADIRDLRESRAKLEGKADQSSVNFSMGIAIISVFISIISIIIHWLK